MKRNPYNLLVCALFLAAIFLPLTIAVFEEDKEISKIEKRALRKLPSFPQELQGITEFPKDFDNYYQDHFGMREILTKQYRSLKYTIGDSPSQDVTIGKNGFLFLGSAKKGYNDFLDPMGDYRGINRYSPEKLSLLVSYMDDLNKWLAQQGIKYALVIAPNKATIYPEMLPNYIQKIHQESALDQLVTALRSIDNFLIIDLRDALSEAKSKGYVYYKTDTHWNYFGANIVQKVIVSELNKATNNDIPIINADIKSSPWDGGDLANFIGVRPLNDQQDAAYFSGTCNPSVSEQKDGAITITSFSCDSKKFSALIFGDSFSNWLRPFFSRAFGNATFISSKFDLSRVENLSGTIKPNFIIEEWVERTLPYNPPVISKIQRTSKEQILFGSSSKVIYQNEFDRLQLINIEPNYIAKTEITLQSTKADPILVFPEISFTQAKEHILKIKINSSVDSVLQLFFSESNVSGYPFSEKNSVKKEIKKGENDIYIQLTNPNLGKALRLDPISDLGLITISELTLKEVDL